jgi:hypothetical protein
MDIINMLINNYGLEILGAILTGLATYLGTHVKKLADRYFNNKTKRELAQTVVRGVEQAYSDLDGDEKLQKALNSLSDMLLEQGITVTELELRLLIEDAVGAFNNVFKKEDK